MSLFTAMIFCFNILHISCESLPNLDGGFTLQAKKQTGYVGETFTFKLSFRSPAGDFHIFIYSNSSKDKEYSSTRTRGVDQCLSTHENDEPDFPEYYKDRRRHFRQFQYVFSATGTYVVSAILGDGPVIAYKKITVKVILPNEFVTNDECEDAIFLVNKKELSTYIYATTLSVDFSQWVQLESLTSATNCTGLRNATVRWTIEKLNQASFMDTSTVPLCLHPSRIGQVNLTSYIEKYAIRSLLLSLTNSELTLQPYSLPPGLFRICLCIYKYKHFRVCGFLVREAENPDVSDMIIASPLPREDHFHWPEDTTLTLDAQTDTYFYYSHPDSGNTGEIKLRVRWMCNNNLATCKYFAKKKKLQYELHGKNGLLLYHTDFTLSILAKSFEMVGFTINISAELYVEDRLTNMTASKMKHWVASFSDVTSPVHAPYISIRCYRKCEREISPTSLLLIALCSGCEHLERDFINVTWGISTDDTQFELLHKESLTWYYYIKFYDLKLASFHVCVLLTYYSEEGDVLIQALSSRTLRVPDNSKVLEPLVVDIDQANTKYGDLGLINIYDIRLNVEHMIATQVTNYPLVFFYFDRGQNDGVLTSSVETYTTLIYGLHELPTLLLVASFSTAGFLQSYTTALNDTGYGYMTKEEIDSEIHKIYEAFAKTNNLQLLRVLLSLASEYFELNPTKTILMAQSALTRFLRMKSRIPVVSAYNAILQSLVGFLKGINHQDVSFVTLIIRVVEHIFLMDQMYGIHDVGHVATYYSYYIAVLEKLFRMLSELMLQHRNLTSLVDLQLDKNPTAFNKDLINVQQKLLQTLRDITDALPLTLNEIYPKTLKMKTHQFQIQACWADSSREELVKLMTRKVEIYVLLSVQLEMFHPLTLDTNMHVAAVVHELYLPATFYGVPLNAPEMHISLQQKTYNPYPLEKNYLDIFNIFYHYEEADEAKKYTIKYKIDTDSDNITKVVDSDCFILQLPTSSVMDTLLKIRSVSGYQMTITAYKSPQKEIMDIFEQVETQLPHFENDSVSGTKKDPNSILLPKLTKMEHATLKNFNWSVMIRLTGTTYKGTSPSPMILKEVITVSCQRLACVKLIQLDQSWTDKDCHATHFSSGIPNKLNCLCKSGETFTGGVSSCGSDMIVPWKYAPLDIYAMRNFQYVSLQLIFYLSALWMVFMAVVVRSRKMDKLHKPLNKTYVMPGLFSPFDKYKYLLCVVTGWFHSSGPLVIPTITIVGSNNISRKYQLHLTECYYKAGAESWFLISSRLYLGNVQYVIVTLERTDRENVSWYVSTLFMRDLLTETDYYCSLNAWFSSSPGGESTIRVKEFTSHVIRRTSLFHRFIYFMVALHLFSGIFYSVPGSKFNKTQHVLSCFMSILLTMTLITQHVLEEDFQEHTELLNFTAATITVSAAVSVSSILVNTLISFTDQAVKGRNPVHWYTPFVHAQLLGSSDDSIRLMRKQTNSRGGTQKMDLDRFLAMIGARVNVSLLPWNESAVDREVQCDHRQTIYGLIVRRAVDGDNLVAMSSLELLMAHRREREKRRITSIVFVHGAPIESIKAAENYKFLHKIVSWLSLPNYVVRSLLALLIVSFTYVPFMSSFQIDEVVLRAYLVSVVNSLIGTAILLQPCIIMLIALLLSDRWPQHKFDADCRVRDVYKEIDLKIKLMKTQNIEAPADSKESLAYTTEYVDLIRRKCKVYSLTKDKKGYKGAYKSSMYRIGAFIVVMFVVIHLHYQDTSFRYLQSEFLNTILQPSDTIGSREAIHIETIWKSLTTTLYYGLRKYLVNINTTASFYMVSAVRVRQIRLLPDKEYDRERACIYSAYLFKNCTTLEENKTYDTHNYAYTWAKLSPRDIGEGPYTHSMRKPIFAEISGGGGYEAMYDLKSPTPYMLEDLKARGWIDRHTRLIIIDLVVYNADTDMATNIILKYEFTEVAIVRMTYYVHTFLMSMSPENDMLLAICETLFLVHAFMNIYLKIKQINGLGYKSLFDSKEAILTNLEPFLYVATIFFRALEMMEKSVIVQGIQQSNVEAQESDYVNFVRFYTLSYILLLLYICITALNFVRVFHSIRNNRHVQIFVSLVPELYDVVRLIFICILFMNFFGGCLFPESRNFSGALFSVRNILGLIFSSLGKEREGERVDLYAMSCSFFLNFVVINHFVAVMSVLYNQVKLRYPPNRGRRRTSKFWL